MSKTKEKLLELIELTSNYIWHKGSIDGIDNFVQEQTCEFYQFYLDNKDYIIESSYEILKNEQ